VVDLVVSLLASVLPASAAGAEEAAGAGVDAAGAGVVCATATPVANSPEIITEISLFIGLSKSRKRRGFDPGDRYCGTGTALGFRARVTLNAAQHEGVDARNN
jgi:hypothetical protein